MPDHGHILQGHGLGHPPVQCRNLHTYPAYPTIALQLPSLLFLLPGLIDDHSVGGLYLGHTTICHSTQAGRTPQH